MKETRETRGKVHMIDVEAALAKARCSYNYCGICGHVPQTNTEEPNYAPLRWWDPDDGWKIGTLCRSCARDYLPCKPKEVDYAYAQTNGVCDDCNTDEDPIDALGGGQ